MSYERLSGALRWEFCCLLRLAFVYSGLAVIRRPPNLAGCWTGAACSEVLWDFDCVEGGFHLQEKSAKEIATGVSSRLVIPAQERLPL